LTSRIAAEYSVFRGSFALTMRAFVPASAGEVTGSGRNAVRLEREPE
jgi:hypothetical protein